MEVLAWTSLIFWLPLSVAIIVALACYLYDATTERDELRRQYNNACEARYQSELWILRIEELVNSRHKAEE